MVPWKVTYDDVVFEVVGYIVTEYVHTNCEEGEEQETYEVSPDIQCLCVQAKHALDAASERIHRRAMIAGQELVVFKPVRKGFEWYYVPCHVSYLFRDERN